MRESSSHRRVFFSHSDAERDLSLLPHVRDSLKRTGFEAVIAEHEVEPLAHLGQKVRELIDSCGYFLALVTPSGRKSEWVQQELGYAYNHHRRDKVIALLVEDAAGLGGFYTGLEYFVFNEATFDRNVASVCSYFERHSKGETQVALSPQRDAELRRTIDQIRTEVKEKAISQLSAQVVPILDSLLTTFSTAFHDPDLGIMTKTGLDNFSMRTETFVTLMDNLQRSLSDAELERALYRAGMQAGRTFGADFCDHVLLENRVAVSSYEDLLEFWLYYDQTAGWGKPRIVRGLPDVCIEVRNSFLVRKSGREQAHRYCNMLRGYVDGFLQFTMRRVPRYMHEARVVFDDRILAPAQVDHESGLERECLFRVRISEESPSLRAGFDHLFKAGMANCLGDGLRCVNHARAAMEFGVKGQLGLDVGDHTSYHQMMRELFSSNSEAEQMAEWFGSTKYYREKYGQLSGSIHQLVEPGPEECRSAVVVVDEFLNALERFSSALRVAR